MIGDTVVDTQKQDSKFSGQQNPLAGQPTGTTTERSGISTWTPYPVPCPYCQPQCCPVCGRPYTAAPQTGSPYFWYPIVYY